MKNHIISLALIASLAACSGGNPFDEDADADGGGTDGGETGGETEGEGITRDGVPPGSVSPSPSAGLFRSEARSDSETGADFGNGFAQSISYSAETDTFSVDNLAFDGDRPYDRGTLVSSLNDGEFAVYEAPPRATDPISEDPINQFVYRAIYGVSRNRVLDADGNPTTTPTTQFAIVRTGNYIPYGFGGFIYQRDTDVNLPSSLQATFSGKSAGLRDRNGAGGLEYATGDVRIDIDFDDFNDIGNTLGDGVKGQITNRRVFDLTGEDITTDVAESIAEGLTEIPAAVFTVGPGVLDRNGDLLGEITSSFTDEDGATVNYETGNYYAIVSGEDPDEIVGVFVLENGSEISSVTTRETSGFIVYRDPDVQP